MSIRIRDRGSQSHESLMCVGGNLKIERRNPKKEQRNNLRTVEKAHVIRVLKFFFEIEERETSSQCQRAP